ncbi:MAG: hypothetical protein IH571_02950, partial [Acholeplasmataceae bacterium]|nr:hypothetical protein [Acholeplasmataceae bacterium]
PILFPAVTVLPYAIGIAVLMAVLGYIIMPSITLNPINWIRSYLSKVSGPTLVTALIGLVVGLVIAALIADAIDDSFNGFIDAFANGSMKWMLSPNAILAINNANTLILAVVVLVTGLILFSGTIIALTTNAIKEYIQKKNAGSGRILLDHQIVILNWNNKVPELVADLFHVDDKEVTVMILADIDKVFAEKQIVNALSKNRQDKDLTKMNVLVKSGDPLLRSNLDDISIDKAKTILIMNPDKHDIVLEDMSKSDLTVIKAILSLGPIQFAYHPPMVVEIKHFETKEKIMTLSKVVETLKEHFILPVCFDKRLGQIITQTLIENRMEDVYLSLFSFQGSEVYYLKQKTFDECLSMHSHVIPLSANGEDLFVLGLNDSIKHKTSAHDFKPIALNVRPIKDQCELDFYILGSNNKLKYILESFGKYELMHKSKFKYEWIDERQIDTFVERLNQSNQKASILLLSDERQKEDALDANVINNLIYLEGHLKNPNVNIVVELLNPKNDPIIKDFNINNTIISNKIISLLLSKLALFENTSSFYENLLTIEPNASGYDSQSIVIQDAKACFKETFPMRFQSKKQLIESVYHSYQKAYIVMGVIRDQILTFFEGDLHRGEDLFIDEDDRLILIRV